MADLQHALDLALDHQRHRPVGDESLRPGRSGERHRAVVRAGEDLGAAFQDGAAGRPGVEPLGGPGRRRDAVTLPRRVLQRHLVRPAEQDGRGVDLEAAQRLVDDDAERGRQVEAAGDRPVDGAEGVEPLQAAFQLRVQREDLALVPPPSGDVHADADHPRRPPVVVREDLSLARHPADRAVRPVDAVLDLIIRTSVDRAGDRPVHEVPVDGMDEPPEPVEGAVEAAGRQAVERLHALRADELVRAEVPVPGPHAAGGQGQPQPLLAPPHRLLGALALGDVHERDHGADDLPLPAHRVGPVFRGEAGPVGAPQDLVGDVRPLPLLEPPVDAAFLQRVVRAVGPGVVDQPVHRPAQQGAGVGMAQQAEAGGVAEGASAVQVDAVDRLAGGVEQQADLLLALPQGPFVPLPPGDVGRDPADGDRAPVGAQQRHLDDDRGVQSVAVRGHLLDLDGPPRVQRPPVIRPEGAGDVRREEVVIGLADDFLLGHPEQPGEMAVDHQVAAVEALEEDGRRDVIEHGLEPRLALAERLLHALSLGHVVVGHHHPPGSVAVEARHAPDEPPRPPRGVAGIFAGELVAAAGEHVADRGRECPRDLGVLARGLVADAEIVGALGDAGAGRGVGQGEVAPGPIDGEDLAGLVQDGDMRRERVEDRPREILGLPAGPPVPVGAEGGPADAPRRQSRRGQWDLRGAGSKARVRGGLGHLADLHGRFPSTGGRSASGG